jgi:hypothetical protein
MLQERKPGLMRLLPRTLACVTASAFFLSTSPVRAGSGEESGGDAAANAWLERASSAASLEGAKTSSAAASATSSTDEVSTSKSATTAATPAEDDGSRLRAVGYIAGGVGIVGLILFAVAGLGAKNAYDRLDESCREGPCDEANRDSDIQEGKLLQKAANIGLVAGIAGIGLGATFLVLGGNQSRDGLPATGPTGAMVTYGARF